MNIFFSIHIINICFSDIEASLPRKKAKHERVEHIGAEHSERKSTVESARDCGFEEYNEFRRSNKRKELEDAIDDNLEQNGEENLTLSSQNTFFQINYLFPKNTESNPGVKASEVVSISDQAIKNVQSFHKTKLPKFRTAFPKNFHDYESEESIKTKCMTQSVSESQFPGLDIYTGSENLARENSHNYFFENKISCFNNAQEYSNDVVNQDSEPNEEIISNLDENNGPLQDDHAQGKHDMGIDFLKAHNSEQPYNDISAQDRDKAIENFILQMANKVIVGLQNELSSIIREELGSKINKHDNSTDSDLMEPGILSDLQNKNSIFYRFEFKKNDDFKEIYKNRDRLVKFEYYTYFNLSPFDVMQKIKGYDLLSYSLELKKTGIHLIVSEIRYLLSIFELKNDYNIAKGHVLLVHYYYNIIKILANLIFGNNQEANKEKPEEKRYEAAALIQKRIFFMRKLLSELFILFQNDINKVKMYRILNMINFFSTVVGHKGSYFRKNHYILKMRFIFRFLFDPDLKPNNIFLAEIIHDIHSKNIIHCVEMYFKKKLTALFYDYYCINIYFDKVLAIIDSYKVYNDLLKFLKIEVGEIEKLKQKACIESMSGYTNARLISMLKIYIELECRVTYLERKIWSEDICVLSFFRYNSFEKVIKKVHKNIDVHHKKDL
ncbi:hypothetical protein CWI36_0061p0030 [Hamiltosporidium magnivora]|uniref:Uncharacterized protein n=1 Tax=Hamiltosporidium magnivora TaxID=148818 RepID=A0A4Q9LNQ1_9MICR|nr:hypothetical protein CWI36_0061p0030 [Hamiltosporidium magnivora]